MLMNVLQTSLKGHLETRWTSKASAIKALYSQIMEVCKVLNHIAENVSANPEFISTARSLLHQEHFQFLCTISAWNPILNHIDKVNQALQSKNVTAMQASKLLTGLKSTLIELREALTD
jgi:molecular chaperone GrpE (heat shock protein)